MNNELFYSSFRAVLRISHLLGTIKIKEARFISNFKSLNYSRHENQTAAKSVRQECLRRVLLHLCRLYAIVEFDCFTLHMFFVYLCSCRIYIKVKVANIKRVAYFSRMKSFFFHNWIIKSLRFNKVNIKISCSILSKNNTISV